MEDNKKEIGLREGNISLVLDSYNDIFSSFDPRLYSEKALSDDFLLECKKAARDKEEGVELRLLIPKQKRNISDESKIKKRLKAHFQRHLKIKEKEINTIKKQGLMWFFLGALIMVVATFLYRYESEGFLINFLFIISEPAGWFTFWEGLGKIFIESREEMPEYKFYKKMSNAQIYFLNY